MKRPKITALTITLNEADNIGTFLQSLDFVDEIILVDSHSTDDTVKIASGFEKVTIYTRDFDNFSAQKNFAISKATHDWIVFFDPDEEVTEKLASEIIKTVHNNPKHVAYKVRRILYFMGKRINYSGFQTDWIIRLFNKKQCRYNDNLVHETIDANGTVGKFKNTLPHHSYKSLDDYTRKLHKYSALQAKMLYQKNVKPGIYHFFIRPLYRFLYQYFIRLGILDGKEGFILAYINAFTVFKRYVNLWMLYRKIN